MFISSFKSPLLIILLTYLTGIIYVDFSCTVVAAETKVFDPLETIKSDPLLPPKRTERPLTTFEKNRIKRGIVNIEREAQAALAAGKTESAFSLWYRALRLQREVSTSAEIAALGRVGAIAWQENRGADLRAIAERLLAIQQEVTAKSKYNLTLLNQLGTAYRKTRYIDWAIAVYQTILAQGKSSSSPQNELNNLQVLGELHLAIFDYSKAEAIYQKLLVNAKTDRQQLQYLNSLTTIYDRTQQFKQAISTKKQLLAKYQQTKQVDQLAAMQIAIAEDYQLLENIPQAARHYQQASTIASQTQQYAVATEALTKLAELYLESDRLKDTLQTYQQLAQIQQKSYNYYGLMDTYDRLGKIYLSSDDYSQARASWQQGLKLAKFLNYRDKYFSDRIEMVNR